MASRPEPQVVPRGRHAPPLEVRLDAQRTRLFSAAAAVFARSGYAEASAEAIAREAGMSKATFYEHFANKEECIVALFDRAAETVTGAMAAAVGGGGTDGVGSYEGWVARGLRAFLETLAEHPDASRTLLVEIIGAGPAASSRRDDVLNLFATLLFRDNARVAPRFGAATYAAEADALAVVGGIVEVVSRRLRAGGDVREDEAVLLRLILGVAAAPR